MTWCVCCLLWWWTRAGGGGRGRTDDELKQLREVRDGAHGRELRGDREELGRSRGVLDAAVVSVARYRPLGVDTSCWRVSAIMSRVRALYKIACSASIRGVGGWRARCVRCMPDATQDRSCDSTCSAERRHPARPLFGCCLCDSPNVMVSHATSRRRPSRTHLLG